MKIKKPLMVCTQARGGMRSVVEAYQRDGIFDRWHFQWLWTHCEGNVIQKVTYGMKAYFKMLGLLILQKISFLHVHAAMRGSFWRKTFFILTARLFNVPCILHLHGSEMKTFYNSLSTRSQRLVRWSLEHADIVIVLSESWRQFILGVAPKANISIVNNYVALPEDIDSSMSKGKFDVLFLGILGHRKGVYDLLEAWPLVLEALPHARLLIGGNGEVGKSKEVAKALGIESSVEFLGWVDGENKHKLLKSTDTFVLPSYNEGLPMSVLEAMSYCKPVVTTTVGGIPELVTDKVNGMLIEPGDQAELSASLIKLGGDLAYRKAIAEAGMARVTNAFSDVVVLPQLEKIYASLLK